MWRFSVLPENAPERNPHESEFFRPKEPSEAIVREFIQNALDAKSKNNYKITIKFTFGQIYYEDSKEYFEGLRDHFQASQVSTEKIFENKEVPFIIIEDFGTTGLDGMTGEDGKHPEGKNNFYNFWWNEGKSEKKGGFRGRWGLGKTTFHSASDIRSYWGFTVRENDNRKLLMGKALLKTHKLDSETFVYYGYFKDERNYTPISDTVVINKFLKIFGVKRINENGFSIVIPYLDRDITYLGILRSTIVHYFYPIINNDLSIEIKDGVISENIDNTNIISISSKLDWRGTDWEKVKVDDFLKFIKSTIVDSSKIELKIKDFTNPQIDEESFEGKLEELRAKFDIGELLSFRLPLVIQKTNGLPNETFLDLYIEKGSGLKNSEEYYIRSGITIAEIKTLGSNPVRGLLVAEDEVITEYLGDAETPAHTTWKENTEGFKEKYVGAHKNLRFIKNILRDLITLVYLPPKEVQKDFLNYLFYIEEPDEKTPREKGTGGPPKPPPPPKLQKYSLTQLNNGFRVAKGKDSFNIPELIKIAIAYDTRIGNPFSGIENFDLGFDDPNLKLKYAGCEIIKKNKNELELKITREDFAFDASGFDLVRDLVVNLKEMGNET